VLQLAQPFAMSQPSISKHLKVLERAGLIAQGRGAQWRPRRLVSEPLKAVDAWLERYRKNWEESYEKLDDYLMTLQKKEKRHARKKK
jgi:DNA-binding transcriptional ArsR family regulator